MSSAEKPWSPNHRKAREFPWRIFYFLHLPCIFNFCLFLQYACIIWMILKGFCFKFPWASLGSLQPRQKPLCAVVFTASFLAIEPVFLGARLLSCVILVHPQALLLSRCPPLRTPLCL